MSSESKIENCPLQIRCDVRWQDLPNGVDGESVRLCTQCKEPVYLVTPAEAADHALLGHCIALADPEDPRKNAMHKGRMGIFRVEVTEPLIPRAIARARVRPVTILPDTPSKVEDSEKRLNRMVDKKNCPSG